MNKENNSQRTTAPLSKILILPSFERSVKKLTRQDKNNLAESLEAFNLFLLSGELSAGLPPRRF